jgi:hypothetical protein
MSSTPALADSNWWRGEIRKRSGARAESIKDRLVKFGIPIMAFLIIFSAYLTIFLPTGGSILCFEVSGDFVKWVQFIAVITNSIGFGSIIWLYEYLSSKAPAFTRYFQVALAIVNELENGSQITSPTAERMRNEINSKLLPLTNPALRREEADKILNEVTEELAKICGELSSKSLP